MAGTWLPVSLVDKELKSAIIALMKVTGSSCGGFPMEAPLSMESYQALPHFPMEAPLSMESYQVLPQLPLPVLLETPRHSGL